MSHFKTFTDELITLGFKFHAETVIVKVDGWELGSKETTWGEFMDKSKMKAVSLFDYCVYEETITDFSDLPDYKPELEAILGKPFVSIASIVTLSEILENKTRIYNALFIQGNKYSIDPEMTILISKQFASFGIAADGSLTDGEGVLNHLDDSTIGLTMYDVELKSTVPRCSWMSEEYTTNATLRTLSLLCHLSQPVEVEIVEYSRQKHKHIKRKTGKTPSPYITVHVGKKRKVSTGNGTNTGQRQKPHHVRSHIRRVTDHPIDNFNGTFLINPHMRGAKGKESKINPKNYRIVIE